MSMTGSLGNNVIDALLGRRTTPAEHDEMIWLAPLGVAA